MILLVGPGGAGKTTAGTALADRLGARFADLDAAFMARHGDISAFIGAHGYAAYAAHNVGCYLALRNSANPPGVMALSSGFMAYHHGIHPAYAAVCQQVACSSHTFVLLPSLDLETCVAEIVRRQLQRPFARTPQREEHVIRSRFSVYAGLPAHTVMTQQPVAAVVDAILALLPDSGAAPSASIV